MTRSGFLVLALVVARLGTDALAAQRITLNALSRSFLPGIGFGIAATALVGHILRLVLRFRAWWHLYCYATTCVVAHTLGTTYPVSQ